MTRPVRERMPVRVAFELTRPFTLLPPLLGMLSGAACAVGLGAAPVDGATFARAMLGALVAAVLNAASNVWNQIYDVEQDRINKPGRPLPSLRASPLAARRLGLWLYAIAIGLSFAVQPGPWPEFGPIVLVTSALTVAYSAPPWRWRRSYWGGPLTIAIPRGFLLKLAGWASVAPVALEPEPYAIALVFFLFVLGASATKDFGDVEGDRAAGCSSLPIRFGARGAATIMAPFYVLPWVLLGLLPLILPLASALQDRALLPWVAAWLSLRGLLTAIWLWRAAPYLGEPKRARREWINLYVLMMEAQILTAVAFLVA